MRHQRTLLLSFFGCWLTLFLCSCASISVQKDGENHVTTQPKKIYVGTFNVDHGEFNVDRQGPDLTEFKKELQAKMQGALTGDLTTRLLPAVPAAIGHEFEPQDGWLVRGEFTRVNQGSRLLRTTIGLGAGGTKMETKVFIYDLTSNNGLPILTFTTTGGSGAEPGAATAVASDPWLFVVGAGLAGLPGATHGVTEDTNRTANQITAQLSDFLHQHGWIPDDQWIKPKVLDK